MPACGRHLGSINPSIVAMLTSLVACLCTAPVLCRTALSAAMHLCRRWWLWRWMPWGGAGGRRQLWQHAQRHSVQQQTQRQRALCSREQAPCLFVAVRLATAKVVHRATPFTGRAPLHTQPWHGSACGQAKLLMAGHGSASASATAVDVRPLKATLGCNATCIHQICATANVQGKL